MDPIQESANCLAEPSPAWLAVLVAPVAELISGRISMPPSFFESFAIMAIERLELAVVAGAPRLDTDLWP